MIIRPVVLCGGSGTRLWPLSRKAFPKQFIPLIGGKSLLQLTLERAQALAGESAAITCISAEEHRFLVADVATTAGVDVVNVLEPVARGTAPAIAMAALLADPEDMLLICPADHHIPDIEAFRLAVLQSVRAAQQGKIVTFGVTPSFPSTAYGYIQRGEGGESGVFAVSRFVEKPTAADALKLLGSGDYFWNAGILLARADALLRELQRHAPDVLAQCEKAVDACTRDGAFVRPNAQAFSECRNDSIDYAVLEKASGVVMMPFAGAWSDVGSWNAIAELSPPDEQGNRTSGESGNAHHVSSRNTYIHAGGGRKVVALGTENLLILDTPDALLVADGNHAEAVKQVVARLEALDAGEVVQHRRVARPWGWYDSVDIGSRYQVKRITVKPGASLSLQMHRQRAEHWVVVSGVAEVTNGEQVSVLRENESTFIPMGQRHRLANPGDTLLEIIEVQSGAYLGEDDIVRFSDAYGRQ